DRGYRHLAPAERTRGHIGTFGAPAPIRALTTHVEDVGCAAAALVMGPGVGPVHFAAVVRNLEALPYQKEIISEILRLFRERLALHRVGKSRAAIFVPCRCPNTVAVCARNVIDAIDAIALPRHSPFVIPVQRT